MTTMRFAYEALYAEIPTFTCKPGCTDCCGPVPFGQWEDDKIGERRREVTDCLTCPYSAADDCSIYPDRPFMCRLFGAADDPRLTCPHGCGPAVKLTAEHARDLTRRYQRLMKIDQARRAGL